MDRHPVLEPLRVHHHVVHALRRSVDHDVALDLHLAPSGSARSHSASAWSTARSKRVGPDAVQARRLVGVARQQVGLEALHQRAHQLERLAGHGRDHGARGRGERSLEAERQPPDAHRLRDPLDHAAVGHHVGPGRRRATGPPHPAPAESGRGTRPRRARRSAGCDCRASEVTAAPAAAPPGERECESSTTTAPITMDARSAVEPGTADRRISSTSRRERRCGDGAACSGTMPPRYTIRSTPARAAASPNALRHPTVAAGEVAVRPGLHRVDQVVRGRAAVERLLEARAGQEVGADDVHVVARARAAAPARARSGPPRPGGAGGGRRRIRLPR